MNIGRTIRSLSLEQLVKLCGFALTRPVLFYCFIKATKQCIAMSTTHFGKMHHKNNQANAYRHALWNILIAFHSVKMGKSTTTAMGWAKTITDWHEMAFLNKPLERAMDLHNNKIGRTWFEEMYKENDSLSVTDIDSRLIKELEYSKKVTTVNQIASTTDVLVYMNDYNSSVSDERAIKSIDNMAYFTFEKYQFKMDDEGFIPLSEFADPLFENDVASLAQIVTEQPDDALFKEKNVVHNIKSKQVETPPDPMFPHITHGTVWEGGIHKDSFADYVNIMRLLQKRSSEWFEKFVDDYNEEVKKRFPKNNS